MRRFRLPLLLAVLSAASLPLAAAKPTALTSVKGSVVRLDGGFLLVGSTDGSVSGFDPKTDEPLFKIPGTSKSPVKDIVWLNNRPWWITAGSPFLHGSTYEGKPLNVDLSDLNLGSIRRLGSWQGMLVIHTDTKVRFMETGTRHILTPDEALPPEVADAAQQGELLTWWQGDSGLVVTLRRIGERSKSEELGAVRDVALLNGWSVDRANRTRLLGGYTASVVDFKETEGARVKVDLGGQKVDLPHSAADVDNLKLGPEGVVALQKSGALVVPFYKENWYPNKVPIPVAPNYAQTMAYHGSTLWWSDGKRLYQSSLEDGSTERYLTIGKNEQIVSIAADAEGAYVLTSNGRVSRVRLSDETTTSTFIRYNTDAVGRDHAFAKALSSLTKKASKKLTTDRFILHLRSLKVRMRRNPISRVSELRYGDLIKDGGRLAVYLGKGEALRLTSKPVRVPVDSLAVTDVMRVLAPSVNLALRGGRLLDDVYPIGLGRPFPALGYEDFVTWKPGSPFDRPYTPALQELHSRLDSWIGVPYRWAGSSYDGTDCSGLVTSLYRSIGVVLPRHSQHIGRAPIGEIVQDELRFGDVLVMPQPKHCAIYVGGGMIIEAISGGVQYRPVTVYRRAVVRRFVDETT